MSPLLILLSCFVACTFAAVLSWRIATGFRLSQQRAHVAQAVDAERDAGRHLCFSILEALAYAIEAGDPFSAGHLDCVQECVGAMAETLHLPPLEKEGLRAAALLHNIGRLGVPEHILLKPDALTPEEQEKLRTHPVLGARILASIPFPFPVLPIVRHHAEHWDGSGYPDGLAGEAIPLSARILAVANAYSALLRQRPFRAACAPADALQEIELRAGTQFDPAIVRAFRVIAADIRAAQPAPECPPYESSESADNADTAHAVVESGQRLADKPSLPHVTPSARAALDDITSAQRETLALLRLAQSVSGSLHLEAVAENVLTCVHELVPCCASALFLPDDAGECLHAFAARGINDRYLLGSTARVGAFLTGRAFSRSLTVQASYLPNDLELRHVSDTWTPFRSTLIVPLPGSDGCVGTLNLYAETPDAFDRETQRILHLVSTQAGRALDTASRFARVQETATTDALTGLRNRRYLGEFLQRELHRAGREKTSLAVLNIDVDNFKQVNDIQGHAAGDQTLRDIAEILTSQVRKYDLAARYAGDEYVVVLARADRAIAEMVALKLKVATDRYTQKMQARDPHFPGVSLSVGVALFPDDASDMDLLLCCSDAAMYQDKTSRKAQRRAA